jgi:TRAP-type mannitol/chloroaromatic compound transport system permease large subunit
MAVFLAQNLAPIMFLSLVLILLAGYPVAFSLGAVGLLFFMIGVELAPLSGGAIKLSWPLLQAIPIRIYEVMRSDTLLAIPFFTFMGLILERSGMAEDLLETIGHLFGTLRGGLAYAVIAVGALLAATTGVVAASVIAMGLISLPIMLRYGYDRRLATGTIAAAGTLAQIIPPSLVLIVLAEQLGRPVDDFYKGAILPGLLLAAAYSVYVLLATLYSSRAAPGLPKEAIGFRKPDGGRGLISLFVIAALSGCVGWWFLAGSSYAGLDRAILAMAASIGCALGIAVLNRLLARATGISLLSPIAERVTFVLVPPLFLMFLVLGTIFVGLATPTEGGALGAVGALLLAAIKRHTDKDPSRLNYYTIRSATEATARLSAFVLFILIGARIFSLTFYGVEGHQWVHSLMSSLPGGLYGFLAMVSLIVFTLAFFLDFFELAFIVVPLLKPASEAIFRSSPDAIAIAKGMGIAVVATTDATGLVHEEVANITPFMVWFGVLLAVNMQTSFMHPPFGFALFYLRSVAPKEPYADKVTGKRMPAVATSEIYWGAVPFVLIQLAMVALVLMNPALVMKPVLAPSARVEMPAVIPATDISSSKHGRFALPPGPPLVPGAPNVPMTGPGAPTLDMSVPPEVPLPSPH